MEKIIVKGGKRLQGEVDISVAKNSVLPIIVATILNPTPIVIKNALRPRILWKNARWACLRNQKSVQA